MQAHISSTNLVFEFGVGPGWNLSMIKAKNLEGYDVASAVRPIVESKGIQFSDQITKNGIGAFDVVICSHVLEHLFRPTDALQTISDCLKYNGKALLFIQFDFEKKFRKYSAN